MQDKRSTEHQEKFSASPLSLQVTKVHGWTEPRQPHSWESPSAELRGLEQPRNRLLSHSSHVNSGYPVPG